MTAAQERIGYALMRAAVIVPLICALAWMISDFREHREFMVYVVGALLCAAFSAVIAWPLALLVGAIPAISLGGAIQRRDRTAIIATVIFTTAAGTIAVPAVWKWMEAFGNPNMRVAGPIAGFLAGIYFCQTLIGSSPAEMQPDATSLAAGDPVER